MDYIKISYIVFLLMVILASLFVYFTFGKGRESMVTIGSDLTMEQDIPGATYTTPTAENRKTKGVNGYGLDPPDGYYKIDIGNGVWKMKPKIPTGYLINPADKTKLIVNPKNDVANYAIQSYKTTTDSMLREGPYTDIPLPTGQTEATESTPLPKNGDGTSKYYRIAPFNDAKGNVILDKYKMKALPTPLPKGYIIDAKEYLIFNPDVTEYAFSTFDSTYDPTKTDIKYHDGIPEVKKEQINNDDIGKYYSFDANGQLIREENTDASFSPVLYYIPGAYKYGSSNYVPNYEDSVYLSRTTRLPQTAPVFNTAGMLGGFCTQFKNNTLAIEEKCGALDMNTCASTSCCTLIGGQKCVAGSENGPSNPANYTDGSLRNKDFYYYQGKCYGNCREN
jgi:hypothetical protein